MTILEALTLCRDQGRRVRPVSWRPLASWLHHGRWIEWRKVGIGIFVERHSDGGDWWDYLRLYREAELLGEWEVVPE